MEQQLECQIQQRAQLLAASSNVLKLSTVLS